MMHIGLNGLWAFTVDQDPEYHRDYDYSRHRKLAWQQVRRIYGGMGEGGQ